MSHKYLHEITFSDSTTSAFGSSVVNTQPACILRGSGFSGQVGPRVLEDGRCLGARSFKPPLTASVSSKNLKSSHENHRPSIRLQGQWEDWLFLTPWVRNVQENIVILPSSDERKMWLCSLNWALGFISLAICSLVRHSLRLFLE